MITDIMNGATLFMTQAIIQKQLNNFSSRIYKILTYSWKKNTEKKIREKSNARDAICIS